MSDDLAILAGVGEKNSDGIYACCADLDNRETLESGQADLELTRCTVCHRRHRELSVDPGQIGLRGAQL